MKNDIIYVHTGTAELHTIKPISTPAEGEWRNKPNGGLWGCRYIPEGPFLSVWEQWKNRNYCEQPCFKRGTQNWFVFALESSADVLTINGFSDYKNISEKLKTPKGFLHWEKIAKVYDAVEITKGRDYWMTTPPLLSPAYYLEAWEVPSILIFRSKAIVPLDRNLLR